MGHLSNPIGFRLNFEKKWNFNFFVKNMYYPEVINNMINLRDYLYYYLTRKKILQSGLCLSHFMVYKYFKKYYIKIYVYHIDLEKTAYDLINKLYYQYYEAYNTVTCKYAKNKTEKQVKLYHFLRDVSNSDVFLVIFIYLYFYRRKKLELNKGLNSNIYNKNKKLKNYTNYINSVFIKQLLYFFLIKMKIDKIEKKNFKRLRFFFKRLQIDKFKRNSIIIAIYKLNKSIKLMRIKIKKLLKSYNKNEKLAKIKGLVLYKAKKLITKKSNILVSKILTKCNYFRKKILKPAQFRIIKLAWYLTKDSINKKIKKMKNCKNSLNVLKEYETLQAALEKLKINHKSWSWLGFYNSKCKLYRILIGKKKGKKKGKYFLRLRKILFDKMFKPRFHNILANTLNYTNTKVYKKNSKIDFMTIFAYLCKKTGFKKVRNTHNLWKKWSVICDYLYLFNKCNLLYVKPLFNINHFFFLIKTAILFSKMGKKLNYNNGHYTPIKKKGKYFYYFNLKHYIFFSLQNGIYYMFFRKTLCLMNLFIKIYIAIIHNNGSLNKIRPENITFTYFFIANYNVTAQFLARYVVLKLKKGFTVVRTINPLKRELKRVSRRSKWRKMPYFNYLVNFLKLKKNTIKKYNFKMQQYKQSCYTFFDYFFYKFYNDNNIIIIPNLFLFYLKYKKKINKTELNYSKTWRLNMKKILFYLPLKLNFRLIRNSLWLFLLSIFKFYESKKKKYKYYKKVFKYRLLTNYKKAQNINKMGYILHLIAKKELINSNIKHEKIILFKHFYFVSCLFNNWIWYTKKKKINNFKIEFSSFFNMHYINYVMLKTLWNIFNKLNLRNERDLYIPKYNRFLVGFKLILKGRFSRKQRASKVTLIIGKVPLNTFKFNIEYAFATIPLKNSAISLKFYLCKNNALTLFKRLITI